MVSSVNHHFSILRMRIHPRFLSFLASAPVPRPIPANHVASKAPLTNRSSTSLATDATLTTKSSFTDKHDTATEANVPTQDGGSENTGTDGFEKIDLEWYGVDLARSKWFDMFKVEDRAEAMAAVWGVLGFMMRDTRETN